jgi:hypothetical protein
VSEVATYEITELVEGERMTMRRAMTQDLAALAEQAEGR